MQRDRGFDGRFFPLRARGWRKPDVEATTPTSGLCLNRRGRHARARLYGRVRIRLARAELVVSWSRIKLELDRPSTGRNVVDAPGASVFG